ncbi:MAG: site-2 protease family protein [Clostridiales bacterium]|nr:site-2 protease family protein [Clostridiales bacterium]
MIIQLIRSLLSGDFFSLISIFMIVIVALLSLSVHECAHGLMAYALGDPTAKSMGRLSLNPKNHLDPVGTLLLVLFGFGWAKPVPINPHYFKNRKRGMAFTALAGPLSNLLLAFVGLLAYHTVYTFAVGVDLGGYTLFWNGISIARAIGINNFVIVALIFFYYFTSLNVSLAIFNLLPIPPLDGSRILNIILPERYYFKVMQYERYIYLVIILLLVTDVLSIPLNYLASYMITGFEWLIGFIPGLL